jgi:hypothetical protein
MRVRLYSREVLDSGGAPWRIRSQAIFHNEDDETGEQVFEFKLYFGVFLGLDGRKEVWKEVEILKTFDKEEAASVAALFSQMRHVVDMTRKPHEQGPWPSVAEGA